MTKTLDSEQATINAITRCAFEAYQRGDAELHGRLVDVAHRMEMRYNARISDPCGVPYPPPITTRLTDDVPAGSTIRVERGRIVIDPPSSEGI